MSTKEPEITISRNKLVNILKNNQQDYLKMVSEAERLRNELVEWEFREFLRKANSGEYDPGSFKPLNYFESKYLHPINNQIDPNLDRYQKWILWYELETNDTVTLDHEAFTRLVYNIGSSDERQRYEFLKREHARVIGDK